MKPTIGKSEAGDLAIDIQKLLATRMLLQADSGGGKSWALKRVLEQTHGHVQQIILDPEGEFSTLREKFDYLLCAPEGADAIATPKTAAILARKLRETRVSAVIDIFDLRMQEQKHFVRLFIEELLAVPKSLWNPCLLIIDEAQVFAPEKDQAESLSAIMDLRGRGRKRGLCPILATPRLGQLSKDAAAGMQNKLIGVTTLDVDVARAARDLSLLPKDATEMLRNLDPGEFFCFGPALTRTITKVKIGSIETKHGQHIVGKDTRPPEPSEKIKNVIAKLTDLPKEAEQEARTLADFKRENSQLKRDLTLARKTNPPAAKVEIKTIEKPVVGMKAIAGIKECAAEMRKASKKISEVHAAWGHNLAIVDKRIDELCRTIEKVTSSSNTGDRARTVTTAAASGPVHRAGGGDVAAPNDLTGPEQRIIDAIAWMESLGISEPEQTAVAFLAGYTIGGGGFNNPRGSLRTKGLVEYLESDRIRLTDAGRRIARAPDVVLSNDELHRRVLDRLPGPEQKLLRVAIEVYPNEISDDELAERTGYTVGSGGYNNPRGRLRSLGLVTYPKGRHVRASDVLFPVPE